MSEFISFSDLSPSLSDDVLITIQPVHASRIYDGSKCYELRKSLPRLVPRRMFLYETNGVSAITGHMIIDEVILGPPEYVWQVTSGRGTSRERFERYFANARIAYAYKIAEAVRYRKPLPLVDVHAIEPGYRVPQQFLYLQNLPALRRLLRKMAIEESFGSLSGDIKLPSIERVDARNFRRLVKRHISKSYSETGTLYADKLLAISSMGEDPEGFLSICKSIRVIQFRRKNIGFAVFTFKLGASVKTGPVIIEEAYQDKGVGRTLRNAIHTAVARIGYRKVFATVPANNVPAFRYLLASNYRVEAHMIRPYHTDHDEFVFGHMIALCRGPGPEFLRQLTPVTSFERITKPLREYSVFLQAEFSSAYCRVPDDWAGRQLELACSGSSEFKPRYAFAASNGALMAMGVCLLKRGGSAKMIVLSRTAHQSSISSFIRFMADELDRVTNGSVRRLYTQVPIKDADLIQAFLDARFRSEGIIERPFSPNTDTILLARPKTESFGALPPG